MEATVKSITLNACPRIICISDIHGELGLLTALLAKVGYTPGVDALVLLGDLYLKGSQPLATLDYIMALADTPHVHILRGNCDYAIAEYVPGATPAQAAWLEALPVILEAEDYIFVHAALGEGPLEAQELLACVQTPAFMEQGLSFDKWVIHGHWPAGNYCHTITSCAPIVNETQKIIAIDGGNVIWQSGQLNAFIIEKGQFSHQSADKLKSFTAAENQKESGGLSITWLDRFVEVLHQEGELSLVRHLHTGRELWMPTCYLWQDDEGRFVGAKNGTDYWLPVTEGDTLKLIERFGDRILAKKGDVIGWVRL